MRNLALRAIDRPKGSLRARAPSELVVRVDSIRLWRVAHKVATNGGAADQLAQAGVGALLERGVDLVREATYGLVAANVGATLVDGERRA